MHTHACTHKHSILARVYSLSRAHIHVEHTQRTCMHTHSRTHANNQIHTCTHTHSHSPTHSHTQTHTRKPTHLHAHAQAHTHTHTNAHTHMHAPVQAGQGVGSQGVQQVVRWLCAKAGGCPYDARHVGHTCVHVSVCTCSHSRKRTFLLHAHIHTHPNTDEHEFASQLCRHACARSHYVHAAQPLACVHSFARMSCLSA